MIKRQGYTMSGLADRIKAIQLQHDEVELKNLLEQQKRFYLGYDPGFDDVSKATRYAVTESKNMESDETLRARLIYIGVQLKQLASMDLDRVAEEYGLKRRKIDREATQPIRKPFGYA